MNKVMLAAPLAVLATALLSGCFTPGPNNPANTSMAPSAQTAPYWAGSGIVQSVTPAPANTGLYRLGIRMDNGRMMYVDTASSEFSAGTRVQLSDNNEIRRL
jgi:hypothetical protein